MAQDEADRIRQQGARSYFELRGEYRNPYPANTPDYNHFERGWSQALRKDDARQISSPSSVSQPSVKTPVRKSENPYAAIKGRTR